MLSFGALNAEPAEDSSSVIFHEVQKEEQEATALLIYNEALALEKENSDQTSTKLEQVLQTDLILQAPESLQEGEILSQNAALFLKYNVLKKLASIAVKKNEKENAINYYLQAAVIDESDVSLWWQVGELSMDVLNLRLARYAFEKGLVYSPNHWICMDKLISILYIVGDYQACLEMIATVFEKDEYYTKGYAIRNQIFKEEPHFKKDCVKLSSLYVDDDDPDESKYQEYVEEALVIRGKRKLRAKREEPSRLKITKPLVFYSWFCLGELLINIYNDTTGSEGHHSLAMAVDLTKLIRTVEQQANLPVPSPDIMVKKYGKSTLKDSDGSKALKRKKLNLTPQEKESEPQPKRRSTRVKLSKTKENDVNWADLVYSFLPDNLKPVASMDTDDSQDSICEPIKNQTCDNNSETNQDLKRESISVSNFINTSARNKNCITLIEEFLMLLSEQWDKKWQSRLPTIYLTLYYKFRKHTQFPNVLCPDNSVDYLAKLGKIILVALEIQLDTWLHQRSHQSSPSLSPFKSTYISNISKEEMLLFQSDLHYISMLAANNSVLMDQSQMFSIRFFYLHARCCMEQNMTQHAMNSLYNCLDCLNSSQTSSVVLHNCQADNVIDKTSIEKIIDSLNQSKSLEELQQIFDAKDYEKIIGTLESLIASSHDQINRHSNQPEKPTQMYLLMESYYQTKCHQKALLCIEQVLREAVTGTFIREHWRVHLNYTLKRLDSYFVEENKERRQYLTDEFVHLLCEPLVKIMEFCMDSEPTDNDAVTTLPWLLIYRIIKWKAKVCQTPVPVIDSAVKDSQPIDVEDVSNSSSSSSNSSSILSKNQALQYLISAHEYLGRKHWCCHDDGVLLQTLVEELYDSWKIAIGKDKEALSKDLEQCFYCLYGNPCKKSKSKSLIDHNVLAVPLTWENCKILYDFYKPEALPKLNVKTFTITLEVQHVMRRIVTVAPQKKIEVIPFEQLQQYVDGGDNLPNFDEDKRNNSCNGMEDLFYYLGDFYFKNKEFNKALKFYMHDVCINPRRFESWAAMAFSRASRLEEKLNQCEMKNENLLKKNITVTLRCYEKAVAINNKRCLILEEYGQTAYMLNSHASRKLKELLHEKAKVDESQCEYYHSMRKDMLLLAEKCFTDALGCATQVEGELWLHYYMLGKTSEKLGKPPAIYLNYYQKSLQELYQSGGSFIKKITYRSPPEYSIEAVEMFYRVHASILKLLKYSEKLDYDLFEEHLNRVTRQQIYLDILEVDQACVKERLNDLKCKQKTMMGSDDPIRELLNDLVEKVCKEERKNDSSIEKDVNVRLNELIDEVVGLDQAVLDEAREKPTQNEPSCDGSIISTTENNVKMLISTNDEDRQPNTEENDVIKIILDSLIEAVCEKTEPNIVSSKDKPDSDIVKECLEDILEKVCQRECGSVGSMNGNIKKAFSIVDIKSKYTKEKTLLKRTFNTVEERTRYIKIAERCLDGFGFCLRRFHEHYKSQYTMAHFLANCPELKNLQWSRDLLLGGSGDHYTYKIPLPVHGIFSGKKKTNLFQYVWRVPVNEIDRPGSFCTHNCQSITLLLNVLSKLMDNNSLIHVSAFLHKTPDKERKYLRDEDRALLAIKAFDMVLEILKKRCKADQAQNSNIEDELKLLMDAYEAYKHSQKMQISQQTCEYCVLKAYQRYRRVKSTIHESDDVSLEEAIKFCQQLKTF